MSFLRGAGQGPVSREILRAVAAMKPQIFFFGWVGLNGLKKSKVTCNISKNEAVNLDICWDLGDEINSHFCCHQQNPWSMVSFDGGVFPQSSQVSSRIQPFTQPYPAVQGGHLGLASRRGSPDAAEPSGAGAASAAACA